jgi:predicted nucleotidyltransferase
MNLPPDLREMLAAFADAGVRYLVIGGHAVSLHARPRTTKDIDFWLDPERANIARACAALRAFGIPAELVAELEAAAPDEIVWLGRPPMRVDFLQAVPALTFEEAWAGRVTVFLGGVLVTVLGLEDLIRNKRAVGRPQDKRDVRALERARDGAAAGAPKPARPTQPRARTRR